MLGDGAGVGKGRQLAGIIFDNWQQGHKKAVWLSVSADLKFDAMRDLRDITAKIPCFSLGYYSYGRIDEAEGIMFLTYRLLISKPAKGSKRKGRNATRLDQLLQWLGPDFNGVICFDESHKV